MSTDLLKPIKLKLDPIDELRKKNVSDLTEAEKMVLSYQYNGLDEYLVNTRAYAKLMCQKFNNSSPLDLNERQNLLNQMLGSSSNNWIEPPFFFDYGSNIHLEDKVYMNHNCVLLDVCEIRIGKNTFLAPGVQIYTAGHPIDPIERRATEFGKPIKIGADCWIGGNAIILPGITIGDGVTIGAGSVVTKDIESFTVAVGNPAKVIKKLPVPDEYKQ